MSFRESDVDLESQTPFSDLPEFDSATEEASNALLDLNNNLVTLSKFIKGLETSASLQKRETLINKTVTSIEKITDLFKGISSVSKLITDYENFELNPAQIFVKEKVTREIKNSLDEFQMLQEKFTKISTQINEEAKTALNEEASHIDHTQQHDRQHSELILEEDVINNDEFLYQQNLIREREEDIQNIEQGVQELNEIFNDLGQIVQEQGLMVDNIESNIYDVSSSTRTAANELTKALNYQRRSKRTTACLLIILVAVLLVVLLGIFL
jgi:syntaxin 7